MDEIKRIEVRWYRNGKLLGRDVGQKLYQDSDGNLFVCVNGDRMHPVHGHHKQTALKGGWVRAECS